MTFLGPIINSSRVVSNEPLGPHFNLLTIKGSQLKNVHWIPGQKVKLSIDNGDTRSYTPLSWDEEEGVMKTLVYMHGNGPGALWALRAKPQDYVEVHGPKSSLKLDEHTLNVIFFGDETTYGLAHALKVYKPSINFDFFFESSHLGESQGILNKLDLTNSSLVSTTALSEIVNSIHKKFIEQNGPQIILTGKQQSIVFVRRELQAKGIPATRIYKKVYWGWKDDPMGKLKD